MDAKFPDALNSFRNTNTLRFVRTDVMSRDNRENFGHPIEMDGTFIIESMDFRRKSAEVI